MTLRTFLPVFALIISSGCAGYPGGTTSPHMYPPQPSGGYTSQQVDQAHLNAQGYTYEVEPARLYNRGARDAIATERLYNRQNYQTQREYTDLTRQRIKNVDQFGRTLERLHNIYKHW